MNYLIIGTGGVGGSIAGFLALAGKEVTCIARGKHLENIRNYGLHLKSDLKGEHYLKVNACTNRRISRGKADVIFVCVKGIFHRLCQGGNRTCFSTSYTGYSYFKMFMVQDHVLVV